jgi:hypothetical protein
MTGRLRLVFCARSSRRSPRRSAPVTNWSSHGWRFFRHEIIALLERHRAEYAIKVPFYPWTGLKARVQQTQTWSRVDDEVSCAEHRVEPARWGRRLRVVVYRRRVHHETAKNFQLDLFDPSNGTYEYSATVTNKLLSGQALWAFICGRGDSREGLRRAQARFRV